MIRRLHLQYDEREVVRIQAAQVVVVLDTHVHYELQLALLVNTS